MAETNKDPVLNELQEMKHRMDVLYSQSLGGHEKPDMEMERNMDSGQPVEMWEPLADIWETSTAWVVELDLPGVSEEDLYVEVNDAQLSIHGKRATIPRTTALKVSMAERKEGRFSKSFRLPPHIQPEAIQANLKGGVLTLSIPKFEKEKTPARKIAVRAD